MKVEQSSGFQPVTITLESRGELAILLASIGLSSFHERSEMINDDFGEKIDSEYLQTGEKIYAKLKEIFLRTKPKTT